MDSFGLNLYSIRNKIETEEAFLKTALELKKGGYSFMQFSGSPLPADAVKRVVEQTGMPVVLTHRPMDRILNDTEKLMEEDGSFGCKNIGLGMMDMKALLDEDAFKATVEKLDKAGEKMKKAGFKFFYHNHYQEFYKLKNGQTRFDYMIENAPNFNFTLDTYWVQYGGENILEFLDKLDGRIECVHLKDYAILMDEEGNLKPTYESVGYGTINFKPVVEKMKKKGVKYFLVEQDNAALLPDTMEQVLRSAKYIKENL